ncbi:hypothetical protein L0337_46325 [candidate division KSB1 bacterium]|nr:hypothetical protein [candidate division KSB1 bacterium]
MEMTLDEVVREMNELEQHMQKFEWKYSIKSAEFYKLVLAGKIEETFMRFIMAVKKSIGMTAGLTCRSLFGFDFPAPQTHPA